MHIDTLLKLGFNTYSAPLEQHMSFMRKFLSLKKLDLTVINFSNGNYFGVYQG